MDAMVDAGERPTAEIPQLGLEFFDYIDDVLLDLDDDIRAAREFALAIARLTETMNPREGLVFQRLAHSAIDHVENIDRKVVSLRQAISTAAIADERRRENFALAAS